jgi:hypothetical protein
MESTERVPDVSEVTSPQTGFSVSYMAATELMFEQPAMVTTSAEAAMAANILRKIYFPLS